MPIEIPTRSKRLQIRMEPSGYTFLEDMARECGLSVSSLAREIIYKEIYSLMCEAIKKNEGVRRGLTRKTGREIGVQRYKYHRRLHETQR